VALQSQLHCHHYFFAWRKRNFTGMILEFDTTELVEKVVEIFKADECLKQNVEKLTANIVTQLNNTP
jgi:hypothetical protein